MTDTDQLRITEHCFFFLKGSVPGENHNPAWQPRVEADHAGDQNQIEKGYMVG